CRRFKVDRLIIEGKASGISAAQELQRLHGDEGWSIETVSPQGDKFARAVAVQPSFSQGLVYAPDREWAQMVIDEAAAFPRGRYKDLTDATTQAIKHLRDYGLLKFDIEIAVETRAKTSLRKQSAPLYPV
ncbi:MAG: phage terminase large subunit, partial [Proteobacteria bacterium]|nr:phage terminase large subunit [Pseudomonadota bacterium]